jgi:hypothetical protein
MDGFERPPIDFLIDAHAEQRAKERYGVALSDNDRVSMLRQISEDRAVFLTSAASNKKLKIFLVWWPSAERIVPVYYKRGKIESVLPGNVVHNAVEAKLADWRVRVKRAEAELRLLKS